MIGPAINTVSLLREFKRIKAQHNEALKITAARVVLGSSVVRVFVKGTSKGLRDCLANIPVDDMAQINDAGQFKAWFESQLNRVANSIKRRNSQNNRINPGYKWGHATKVLTLYLREVVLNSRYFSDEDVKRISPFLYTPIDSIAINRLRQIDYSLPFRAIKEIDSPDKFYGVQDYLGEVAVKVNVPRVWFDDNWGDRQ